MEMMVGSCSMLSALQEAEIRLLNDPTAMQGGDAGKGEPFLQNSLPSIAILVVF